MKDPKDIRISAYNYPLPDERIAKFPLAERDQSKLLVYDQGQIGERTFSDLPSLLPEGALLVMNNTRVIQARLHFYKDTGARVEILVLEPFAPREYQENFARRGRTEWLCMVGGLKKWKQGALTARVMIQGEEIEVKAEKEGVKSEERRVKNKSNHSEDMAPSQEEGSNSNSSLFTLHSSLNGSIRVAFTWPDRYTWSEVLEAMGELPIPPYLNRATEESDKQTYQTVYSKIEGSVAAPTAGLHFTERVLRELDARGIDREEVTLHVGAGTFRPVKSEDIGHHDMHTEHIAVRRETIERLIAHGGHAIAVGTTSVRTLESLYWMGRKLQQTHPSRPTPLPLPCREESGQYQTVQEPDIFHVSQWEPYESQENNVTAPLPTREGQGVGPLLALLAYMQAHDLDVLHASTQIIIAPGYEYRIVRAMITNFHQPQSTLLLLVSAFIGEDWRHVYDYALAHDFRFLSYGDSSLLIPRKDIGEPSTLP